MKKTFSFFTDYGALNSKPVFQALIEGTIKQGHSVVLNSLDADVAVIWSMLWQGRMSKNKEIYDFFKSQNKPVIVLEVGSIIRGITWRVGVNGIDPDKLVYSTEDNRQTKFNLDLKKWREDGNHILVCCQNEKSRLWTGLPSNTFWVENIIAEIRKVTEMEIRVRPHPRSQFVLDTKKYKKVSLQIPKLQKNTYDSYDLSFENTWATINWNSGPGPQSIINGIPAYTSTNSIAYPVSIKSLTNITKPDLVAREEWLDRFSKSEFTLDELRSGSMLKTLTFL